MRFFDREDYQHDLENGPWIIMGHYLTVCKWKPNFRLERAKIESTMVWVCFPGFLIEVYDDDILSRIGGCLGTTVKINMTTL